jgi:hypothetical protein
VNLSPVNTLRVGMAIGDFVYDKDIPQEGHHPYVHLKFSKRGTISNGQADNVRRRATAVRLERQYRAKRHAGVMLLFPHSRV